MTQENPKDPYEKRRKEAMEKATNRSIEHEKSFIKSENSDVLQKRMGANLFKGGME